MHRRSLVTALTFAAIAGTVALAAPKAADGSADMNNEIIPSGVVVTKNGESASASWGGFHASASLADDGSAVASAGNSALGAGAGLYGAGPAGAGAGAGAGLYGTGAASSAGVPSKPLSGGYGNAGGVPLYHQGGGTGNGFFDRIFAIPINVLQSVNTYLNQKQLHQGQQGPVNGHGASASASSSSSSASYGAGKAPEAVAVVGGADYGHGPSGGGAASASYGHGKPGAPMMIPITALRSVQNLLNG